MIANFQIFLANALKRNLHNIWSILIQVYWFDTWVNVQAHSEFAKQWHQDGSNLYSYWFWFALCYSPRGQGIEPESSGGYTPRERGRTRERRPRERSGGILDIGFDGLLDQPRRGGASQVPPGLQYQPS